MADDEQARIDEMMFRIRDYEGVICRVLKKPDGGIVAQVWEEEARMWRAWDDPDFTKIMRSHYASEKTLDRARVPVEDRGPWKDTRGVMPDDEYE